MLEVGPGDRSSCRRVDGAVPGVGQVVEDRLGEDRTIGLELSNSQNPRLLRLGQPVSS